MTTPTVRDVPRGLAAFSLAGKKALITGGNRGLGFAFTQALADCGASVAFIGRSSDANQISPLRASRVSRSGFTEPETTDSPRPGLASITA